MWESEDANVAERAWGGLGIKVKVSPDSGGNCEGKKRERSGHPGVPILAFMGLACQLACIVVIGGVILLLTGITSVALAARATEDRIRGGFPKFAGGGTGSTETSRSASSVRRAKTKLKTPKTRSKFVKIA